ncbi:MAG: molybdopterin-guanine dinucleotide biosynthesis protein B [Gemmatimonadetes bacterium]|nr:molybdopterin-guanine dinucleotide biosynthesis protein B [Gemmatimonadota bacterium]NNM05488.1 molybdopterin-guanine dinucleotide biosynthesis protein B [Gemmatimonadota bacterium]
MTPANPPVVCIIGRKNAGKTELTVALGAELNRRGYRVMTVKHGHGFQIDRPGRDSWRHRHEGGAARTVLAGPGTFAVIGAWSDEELPLSELVHRYLSDADIVLAEGFKDSPEPKVEVFREGPGLDPIFGADPGRDGRTIALVTDGQHATKAVPAFDPGDPDFVGRLTDLLEKRFLDGRSEKEGGAT